MYWRVLYLILRLATMVDTMLLIIAKGVAKLPQLSTLLVLIVSLPCCMSMVAYDCDTLTLNYTTISMIDIPACEYPKRQPKTTLSSGYIAQMIKFVRVPTLKCKITISRLVHICDVWSVSEAATADFMSYPLDLESYECVKMHNEGVYKVNDRTTLTSLKLNKTTYQDITLAGGTIHRGGCDGGPWKDQFGSYTNVVVNADYHIELYRVEGTLDIANQKVIFTNGLRCDYTKGRCKDDDGTLYEWDVQNRHKCDFDTVRSIYYGSFNITTYNDVSAAPTTYLIIDTKINYMTLKLGTLSSYCNMEMYTTNMDNVVVFLTEGKYIRELRDDIPEVDVSINMQYLTKMVGMDLYLRGELDSLYSQVIYNDCNMERRIIENQLHIAATDPIEYAYIYNNGPGATAIAAGEVIHIAKCTPVEVKLTKTSNCYKEIAVTYNNSTKFVNSRNRIIQDTGSVVPCTSLFGTRIRENGVWYQVYPEVSETKEPKIVSSHILTNWTSSSMDRIISGGLYSNEEVERAQRAIIQPYREQSVSSGWAMQVIGTGYKYGKVQVDRMIDVDAIDGWMTKAWERAWGTFSAIGTFFTTIWGVYICCTIVFYIISTVMNGHALYKTFGFSWKILAALFHGLASAVVNLEYHKRHTEIHEQIKKHSDRIMSGFDSSVNAGDEFYDGRRSNRSNHEHEAQAPNLDSIRYSHLYNKYDRR